MTIWFTSDLHLGHRLVAGLRGFGEDTQAHDKALAAGWDERVHKDDHVWVLGDLSLGNFERALDWVVDRPGVKHLVLGNHDPGHPMHRHAHKYLPRYARAFRTVQSAARRRIGGVEILLSHFPYTTDRGFEARYPQWRFPDLGVMLLHGHTHSQQIETSDHEIHIGLDAWDLQLVPESSIVSLLIAANKTAPADG